jgi:hypothetical protein
VGKVKPLSFLKFELEQTQWGRREGADSEREPETRKQTGVTRHIPSESQRRQREVKKYAGRTDYP